MGKLPALASRQSDRLGWTRSVRRKRSRTQNRVQWQASEVAPQGSPRPRALACLPARWRLSALP